MQRKAETLNNPRPCQGKAQSYQAKRLGRVSRLADFEESEVALCWHVPTPPGKLALAGALADTGFRGERGGTCAGIVVMLLLLLLLHLNLQSEFTTCSSLRCTW